MATEYLTNDTDLKLVADAIRGQTGKTNAIAYPDGFVSEIETLVNTSDADAAASDIASGKTAYVRGGKKVTGNISTYFSGQTGIKGDDITLGATSSDIFLLYEFFVDELFKEGSQLRLSAQLSDLGDAPTASVLKGATFTSTAGLKVTGTMPNNGAVTTEVGAGETYTIPKGYHNGAGTVKGKAATSTEKETWVLNNTVETLESVLDGSVTEMSYNANFTSDGTDFSSIVFSCDASGDQYGVSYDTLMVYGGGNPDMISVIQTGGVDRNIYRKLTFDTPPTGDLLTWLQANGVKQASDTAVQESKALTVTSNGTVSVTPDAPYDALKKVDVTVDVASSGGAGFSVTFPATATNWDRAEYARLALSDGTFVVMTDYSVVAGQTVNGVIGIQVTTDSSNVFWMLKMTIEKGAIASHDARYAPDTRIYVAQAGASTDTVYGASAGWFWWPLADTVISSIEMYNTD